jgi:hypothetical protein
MGWRTSAFAVPLQFERRRFFSAFAGTADCNDVAPSQSAATVPAA